MDLVSLSSNLPTLISDFLPLSRNLLVSGIGLGSCLDVLLAFAFCLLLLLCLILRLSFSLCLSFCVCLASLSLLSLSLSLSLPLCVHCGVAGTKTLKFIGRGVKWHLKVKELVEKIRNETLKFAPHCNENIILCFGIPPHCNDLHIFKSECANHYSGVQIQN